MCCGSTWSVSTRAATGLIAATNLQALPPVTKSMPGRLVVGQDAILPCILHFQKILPDCEIFG
jgi:hypothetical protein